MYSEIFQYFVITTAWKVSKCGVISSLHFPLFSPNKGKYVPEITPYLDTFQAVHVFSISCSANFDLYKFYKTYFVVLMIS